MLTLTVTKRSYQYITNTAQLWKFHGERRISLDIKKNGWILSFFFQELDKNTGARTKCWFPVIWWRNERGAGCSPGAARSKVWLCSLHCGWCWSVVWTVETWCCSISVKDNNKQFNHYYIILQWAKTKMEMYYCYHNYYHLWRYFLYPNCYTKWRMYFWVYFMISHALW